MGLSVELMVGVFNVNISLMALEVEISVCSGCLGFSPSDPVIPSGD